MFITLTTLISTYSTLITLQLLSSLIASHRKTILFSFYFFQLLILVIIGIDRSAKQQPNLWNSGRPKGENSRYDSKKIYHKRVRVTAEGRVDGTSQTVVRLRYLRKITKNENLPSFSLLYQGFDERFSVGNV